MLPAQKEADDRAHDSTGNMAYQKSNNSQNKNEDKPQGTKYQA